jgi:hypothetical protein
MENATTLADDLLVGAESIAKFVFGAAGDAELRRVYWLSSRGILPTFKLGHKALAARKSALLKLGTGAVS